MTPRVINRFFTILSHEFDRRAVIIVTGAAAGSLLGYVRPSHDIDFGVTLARPTPRLWEAFQAAIDRTTQQTGIPVNYASDIDRWSSISLLDWRRHTIPHKRIGLLDVRVLDPVYWSIGKLGRYFDLDVHDAVAVFRRVRVPPLRLVQVWGRALRASPPSPALFQFRTQVEHFLRTHGRVIWGRAFDVEAAIRSFHRAAGLRLTARRES